LSPKDLVILGCSSQQPTRYHNHGAYLVRWNEEGLLFDPGEGTQRQFIFAEIAPPVITRIFVSHFHGDHCLGLGSMLMRLNLDKVTHPIHCYYPKKGKRNFKYLRYGCVYHETIKVVEHPVHKEGIVDEDDKFIIEACFLEHGIQNVGWRITERDKRKFSKEKLSYYGIQGVQVREIEEKGFINIKGKQILLDDVSSIHKGESIAVVLDTKPCDQAIHIAQNAKVLLCESTFLDSEKNLAKEYAHMTAKDAALLAKKANVQMLILTHFSARYQDLSLFEKEAREIFPNSFVAEDFKRFDFSF